MHALTQQVVAELDVLYGLYQMAGDVTRKLAPEDEIKIQKVLEARQRILDHTSRASEALSASLKRFQVERIIPSNERALVDEKRNLLLDAGARIQAIDHQMIRQMQAKMAEIRKDLASQTERKNAAKAYLQAPQAQMLTA
jgi:hypothetical protein